MLCDKLGNVRSFVPPVFARAYPDRVYQSALFPIPKGIRMAIDYLARLTYGQQASAGGGRCFGAGHYLKYTTQYFIKF